MKNILKGLAIGLLMITGSFSVGALISYATTLSFVQTPTIALYSGLSVTGTSMRVTPYPKDLDGNKLTMTSFGSSPTLTVDPKKSGYEEIIGFTGITDNGDNTATLTGLTRDLASQTPYTTSGTGKTHGAGALVVFSNNPQMYARFAIKENDTVVTGLWNFNSYLPTSSITATSSNQFAIKSYVDGVAIAGAPTSQEGVTGISRLATQIQMASSTFSAGTPTVLYSAYSTSSPYKAGLWIPITQNNGTLNPNFISTSSDYVWSGNNNFTGPITASSSNNFIASSTQYIENVGVINATSTIKINGNAVIAGSNMVGAIAAQNYTSSSATTTVLSTSIPGGSLSTQNVVNLDWVLGDLSQSSGNSLIFEMGYGTASSTMVLKNTGADAGLCSAPGVEIMKLQLWGNSSTGSQLINGHMICIGTPSGTYTPTLTFTKTIAVDSTVSQPFVITVRTTGAGGNDRFVSDRSFVQLIK
jgi:hypothetical protein